MQKRMEKIYYSFRPVDRNNYNSIDLAKFFAAILVIMIHVQPFGRSNSYPIIVLNYCVQNWLARIAVPFFFVCSGFLLYKKTNIASFHVEPTKKKIVQLIRLYLIWTFIYSPLIFRVIMKDPRGILHALLLFIRDFFFTGSFTQLWYFPATIFAFILISFLLSKRVPPIIIVLFSLFAYIVGLLAQSWFGLLLPLKTLSPDLWNLLKTLQKIIVTTRDGFFEGFFFVGLGMLFSCYDINISKKKALIGFLCSLFLMLVEAIVLKYINYVRATDMYLFLVPTAFFGFCFVLKTQLPYNSIFLVLRRISSLVFYLHPWVTVFVSIGLKQINATLANSPLLFVLTTIITIIVSFVVTRMSKYRHFQWLKRIYF